MDRLLALDPSVIGAVIGAATVGAVAAATLIARYRAPKRATNGQTMGIRADQAPAGAMRVEDWKNWIREIIHEEVRDQLQPILEELRESRRELARLASIIDPSGRTPGAGRKSQR